MLKQNLIGSATARKYQSICLHKNFHLEVMLLQDEGPRQESPQRNPVLVSRLRCWTVLQGLSHESQLLTVDLLTAVAVEVYSLFTRSVYRVISVLVAVCTFCLVVFTETHAIHELCAEYRRPIVYIFCMNSSW